MELYRYIIICEYLFFAIKVIHFMFDNGVSGILFKCKPKNKEKNYFFNSFFFYVIISILLFFSTIYHQNNIKHFFIKLLEIVEIKYMIGII